jgi:hypothetical protein
VGVTPRASLIALRVHPNSATICSFVNLVKVYVMNKFNKGSLIRHKESLRCGTRCGR